MRLRPLLAFWRPRELGRSRSEGSRLSFVAPFRCSGVAATGGGSSNGSLSVDINAGGGGTIAARDIEGWPSTAPADMPAFPGHVDNLMVGRQNVRMMPDGAPGGMSISASDAG